MAILSEPRGSAKNTLHCLINPNLTLYRGSNTSSIRKSPIENKKKKIILQNGIFIIRKTIAIIDSKNIGLVLKSIIFPFKGMSHAIDTTQALGRDHGLLSKQPDWKDKCLRPIHKEYIELFSYLPRRMTKNGFRPNFPKSIFSKNGF